MGVDGLVDKDILPVSEAWEHARALDAKILDDGSQSEEKDERQNDRFDQLADPAQNAVAIVAITAGSRWFSRGQSPIWAWNSIPCARIRLWRAGQDCDVIRGLVGSRVVAAIAGGSMQPAQVFVHALTSG